MQHINKKRHKLYYIFLFGIIIFLVALPILYLFLFNPTSGNYYPPCPFYYLTGYYCPGCGSLRGMHQLLHGHIIKALDYNPLMVLSIPFIIYLVFSQYDIKLKGKKLIKRVYFSYTFYTVLLLIIFTYWIIRNIPLYPFTILAP